MSDRHQKLPPKKEVAFALLEGSSMFVHLDPRRPGVLVPPRFRDKPQLVLQIGLNMFVPIPDLKVDDEGITCTLSFDRAPFWVRMPWSAVYALVGEDGRGMMWPNDIPPEVVAQMQNPQQQQQQRETPKAAAKRPRPKLSAVGSKPREREQPEEEAEEAAPLSSEKDKPEKTGRATVTSISRAAQSQPSRVSDGNAARVSDGNAARTRDDDEDDAPPPPEPARRPSGPAGRKPKRELPPYLRVIK
ncbi:MAG TPA: ClpXP protease specificity-enhancing factor SspB [Polyangium sp.]|nr:ClpXP protease specificity-enhancing factor SspB [Polyangium sp.]